MVSRIKSNHTKVLRKLLSRQVPIVEHAKNAMQNVQWSDVFVPVNAVVDQVGHR